VVLIAGHKEKNLALASRAIRTKRKNSFHWERRGAITFYYVAIVAMRSALERLSPLLFPFRLNG